MSRNVDDHKEDPRTDKQLEGTSSIDKINLKLTFDAPFGLEQKHVQALFKEHGVDFAQLSELTARSEGLRTMLEQNPELAQEFTQDPVKVVARVFPELKLPEPLNKAVLADKYRVTLKDAAVPPDGALLALRRTLEFVTASFSNEKAFEAEPLSSLRSANVGQPAADVDRAERALEQVLGIYRIERFPIEDWVYASNMPLTARGPRRGEKE